jgi:transposase
MMRFCHSPAGFQNKGRNPNSFIRIWVGRIPFVLESDHSGSQNLAWPDFDKGGWNPTTVTGCCQIPASARFRWWSTAWTWRLIASFKKGSNVSTAWEKWFTLLKSLNHFSKFTKHFLSNGNHFPIDYYFPFHQTPKNAKIIFQKLFYAKTNRA